MSEHFSEESRRETSRLLDERIREAVADIGETPEFAEELIAFARERGAVARLIEERC